MPASCAFLLSQQSKKRQYDQEIENLEKQQKQTIERLEQEHTNRLRDEAKRIKAEQEKELSKFQNMLKNKKKEVRGKDGCTENKEHGHSQWLRLGLPRPCELLSEVSVMLVLFFNSRRRAKTRKPDGLKSFPVNFMCVVELRQSE